MTVLECQGLTKSFGGLEAVKQVNLRVMEGERKIIIGPNGAGKTTLFNLISGEIRATGGSIRLFGREITTLSPHKRAHLGLSRTFQICNIFPSQSVLDNLIISQMGLLKMKYSFIRPSASVQFLFDKAQEMMERVGIASKAKVMAKNLSYGEQRQLEISMALISTPKILLLDEPTAGLSQAETKNITQVIKNLQSKITVLMIEHDMDVAFELADSITVLESGQIFLEGKPEDIRNNKDVQKIYLGTE